MPFDNNAAANLSSLFRSACETRLDSEEKLLFERFLLNLLGVKNLRNVQLWTRFGTQTRNFINNRLGQYELSLRSFVAQKFVYNQLPNFPVKYKSFSLSELGINSSAFMTYYNEGFIREYTNRIFIDNGRLFIEYAADSDTNPDEIDFDSPEFDDILEA